MVDKHDVKNKRILIINNESLTAQNATAITMRSIFSSWDVNYLFEISCTPSSTDSLYKGRELKALPHKYYPIYYLLNLKYFRKANAVSKEKHNMKSINNSKNFSSFLRRLIIAYTDFLPLLSPYKLLKEVKEFKPDYIYTMGGSILSLKLALYFSKKLDRKIIVHFMDNWQDTMYNNSILLWPCRRSLVSVLNKVYKRMDKGLTISDKMADEYSNRWNKEHIAIMNIVDDDLNMPEPFKNKDIIKIAYVGGLHLERWKTLLEISNLVERINDINHRKISLEVYTSENNRSLYKDLFKNKYTEFKGSVAHSEVKSVYKSVDILLHMESFNPSIRDFIKYSISTKISEYMASGKPIILYAPPDLALSEYIKNTNSGIVCSNSCDFVDALKRLSESPDIRYEYGFNGIATVKKQHTQAQALTKLNHVFYN